jgi:hypothetical protein
MISFVFDNNALNSLSNREDYSHVKEMIHDSRLRCMNSFFFPVLSFLEYLKGINFSSFGGLHRLIYEARDICGERNILLQPGYHVGIRLKKVDDEFESDLCAHDVKMISDFLGCRDYSDYVRVSGKSDEVVKATSQRVYDMLLHVQSESRKRLENFEKIEKKAFLSPENSQDFFEWFLKGLVKSSFIGEDLRELSMSYVKRFVPSLRYFSDVWQRYAYITEFTTKKARSGDNFDTLYTLYLDRCDYLVTDDRSFTALCNDTESLARRLITTDRLVQHLKRPQLPARAPLDERGYPYYAA